MIPCGITEDFIRNNLKLIKNVVKLLSVGLFENKITGT